MPTLFRSNSAPRREASYVLPRDAIHLGTNDVRLLTLADRLWDRAPAGAAPDGRARASMAFTIDVLPAPEGRPPAALEERWDIGTDVVELSLGDHLYARIDGGSGCLVGRVSGGLVSEQPSLVARLLLETPAAVLLARRGYGVLHAGAVAGPGGAVVIRGGAGAGKSTMVAAALQSGFQVLGDETVLVSRSDPDDLISAVRDVTLLPDATRLLGLEDSVTMVRSGGEDKDRLDLFPSSCPAVRRARRVATVLLGSRDDGPARLDRLTPETFLREFLDGEIPQERWSGTPEHIAAHWSRTGAYRLSGAADLAGAVQLLTHLVSVASAAMLV